MINSTALKQCVEESGFKYKHIANKLGITPYGLQKKIKNDTEFKASEITALCNVLSLSKDQRDKIFFAEDVDFNSTIGEQSEKTSA